MADNATTGRNLADSSAQEPSLRKGRSADPAPKAPGGETSELREPSPEESAGSGEQDPRGPGSVPARQASAEEADSAQAEDDSGEQEQLMARSRLRRLRLLLRQCDHVMLMDFDLLAMSRWPDNYTLAAARRSRDLWLFSATVAALIFLSGLSGFVPAWIAGGGFGAFVIIVLLGLPGVRRIYTARPSYLDLILRRRQMMRDARKHIEHLEGKEGLAWQCARLAEFNPTLRSPRFSQLITLSEHRVLPRNLVRREHVRLYLIFLLEAEKGYKALQSAYLEGHQKALDKGWSSAADSSLEAESDTSEQTDA